MVLSAIEKVAAAKLGSGWAQKRLRHGLLWMGSDWSKRGTLAFLKVPRGFIAKCG
jgi:hypothetical protein